jgi:YD repeat-containing protein
MSVTTQWLQTWESNGDVRPSWRGHACDLDYHNGQTTNTWYDMRGDVVAVAAPGGLATKTAYDGAGRAIATYTSDGAGDTSWVGAQNVAGDTVLEQDETQYDGDGNAIEEITRQRFAGATGTRPLGNPSSGTSDGLVPARVYYTGLYYDAANRLTAKVDVGTNGGSAWTRPSTDPTPSDTVLVTSDIYNAAGWLEWETDPRGVVTYHGYDNLGREVEAIVAYTDGVSATETNQTTLYAYDGSDHVVMQTSMLPGGGDRELAWAVGRRLTIVPGNDTLLVRMCQLDRLRCPVRIEELAVPVLPYEQIGMEVRAQADRVGPVVGEIREMDRIAEEQVVGGRQRIEPLPEPFAPPAAAFGGKHVRSPAGDLTGRHRRVHCLTYG